MEGDLLSKPIAMCIVGARPNLVKMAPILRAMDADGGLQPLLVHTGQHYDAAMSDVFFKDLDIRYAPVNLGVGSGTHAAQTGTIMRALEELVSESAPSVMVTVGDVNSTLAAALVAAKAGLRQAHVEAGLRSGDPEMPEEVNRVVTDRLADLLFTHSDEADENLIGEGVSAARIHKVGNVMIDSLLLLRPRWQGAARVALEGLPDRYAVVTLHRPSNVDNAARRTDGLSRISRPRRARVGGTHRFGWHPGGDHRAWRSLPHVAQLDRASSHDPARDQPLAGGGSQRDSARIGDIRVHPRRHAPNSSAVGRPRGGPAGPDPLCRSRESATAATVGVIERYTKAPNIHIGQLVRLGVNRSINSDSPLPLLRSPATPAKPASRASRSQSATCRRLRDSRKYEM